ncbi:MAG: ATP-binding cassette domain-containing protein [Enterococcus aquimarinus]|uniref:ATP-binding cassette domain-containing protein n=1 Tax=Enterococcus aquimarinus TaxID=328396 RepID=A0A9E3ZR48_9ENTE|nr:ATP-binding cassette domain-containing protein [Enterococcus aquimarinus]
MIKVKNVTKTYKNGQEALKNISFEIEQGEFVYCVGPSGSGKSTLFKMMAKEIEITDGSIQLNQYRVERLPSRQLFQLRRQVGIVAQEDLLLPNVSCFQNIAFSLKVLEKGTKEIREKTRQVLELVDMQDYQHRMPEELSVGQRKKIAIARALVTDPSVLLADEPTANLDIKSAVEVMKLFLKIHQKGTTVLLATHDSTMVNSVRQRVLELKHGHLIRDDIKGGYSLFSDPKDVYVW